jgi:hypothetical protein
VETNLQSIAQDRIVMPPTERRASGRKALGVPGRIIWHDHRGTPRFSSVVTRDVSEQAAYVECLSGPPIPLHRLVYLQLDRTMRGCDSLPAALKQGKVLSAVSRVGAVSNVTGLPDGYALRLLVEPRQEVVAAIPVLPDLVADASLALPA